MPFSHAFAPRAAGLLLAPLVLFAAPGCSSDQKQTYPTKGKLVWPDDSAAKELAEGLVVLHSDVEDIGAQGTVNQDGSFVLGTYKEDDGAVAGKHKVVIVQPADPSAGDYRQLQVVDRKYESMETTDLEVTIDPKANEIVLKVAPGAWMKKQKK